MPANLSPEFKDAQEAYRRAHEAKERLECLKEMLRTIPKHKGTEHLQADIRTRIKQLTEELAEHKKAGGRGPAVVVRPEGAAQVVLLGPANAGKSSLHVRLTGSHAVVGAYPFATKLPLPGMLPFEDIHFQLVDLPPITAEYFEPWMGNSLEPARAALVVLDLADPGCVEQLTTLRSRLADKRVELVDGDEPPPTSDPDAEIEDAFEDPFRVRLRWVILANKCDQLRDAGAELEAFRQLASVTCPALAVSARTGEGLDRVGRLLFEKLGVVRVYTKVPGHRAERERPFTLPCGATVGDVARLVHRGRAAELKFARVWGSGEFDGQQVGSDHVVRDRDVVELHW